MKTEYLLQREVDLVLAALTETNRLVMRTALHTGLRVGDVLQLQPWQLRPHFWVTEDKTGKRRQVGLPEPLLSDLRNHAGEHWVFPGRNPRKHHTRQAVWKDVKRAAAGFIRAKSELTWWAACDILRIAPLKGGKRTHERRTQQQA